MAIRGYTGLSVSNTVATINELSTTNNWGITSVMVGDDIAIKDSDEHTVMTLFFDANDGNGILCYYNNGSSSIGRKDMYLYAQTCDIYSTSHGFIIISHAPSAVTSDGGWYAFLNVNDDGKIICGNMTGFSTTPYRVNNFSVCSYGDSGAMALNFTRHSSSTTTTLCNMTGTGILGNPSVAQYTFYSPVYQTTATGVVDIDGEQYVTVGYWYMKD